MIYRNMFGRSIVIVVSSSEQQHCYWPYVYCTLYICEHLALISAIKVVAYYGWSYIMVSAKTDSGKIDSRCLILNDHGIACITMFI